jgi:hypothetical protein
VIKLILAVEMQEGCSRGAGNKWCLIKIIRSIAFSQNSRIASDILKKKILIESLAFFIGRLFDALSKQPMSGVQN